VTPLPIDASLDGIVQTAAGRWLVLVAPPGSGKTTRVPPALLRTGLLSPTHGMVVILQPRRIAARAAAARVAQERGWRLGEEVGYQVRFERRVSPQTRVLFLTEGILTRQLLADPFLENVGAVILDEFHERSLHTDLALALLAEIRREVRPDLILLVMSATLDAEPVAHFLDDCPIVRVASPSFDVIREYRPSERPASPEAIVPVIQELLADPTQVGHVLVFLPGWAEIRRASQRLEPIARDAGALVIPLHGSLPRQDQDRALRPSTCRKIILSTNVAETSLTIDGVTTVIDTGLARIVRYDDERGIDRWETARISRASADQRAGRAGRTGPGRCIRLWSLRAERGLAEFEQPEIHRVDLGATALALHAWGISDPGQFRWYEPPSAARLAAAERVLGLLGAVKGRPPRITPLGHEMLALPVHPRLSRMMLAAATAGRTRAGAAIAALLSEKDIKARTEPPAVPRARSGGNQPSGRSDILERLDLLAEAVATRFSPSLRSRGIDLAAARHVALVRDDLLRRMREPRTKEPTSEAEPRDDDILRWLLLAYPDRVVKRRGAQGTGVMLGGRGVRLGPESVVRDAELFLALDAREDRRGGRLEVQVSLASEICLEWLAELFPDDLHQERVLRYDEPRRRVISTTCFYYHDLLLREDLSPSVARDGAGSVLAAALRPDVNSLFRHNPAAALWLARVGFLRQAVPELDWPDLGTTVFEELLEEICHEKTQRDEVERIDLVPYLRSRLNPAQMRELNASAPESLALPNGRHARLSYEPGRPPILAVRLQELFGWTETPRVARGRVPVLFHLLAPNRRPIQITDDLHSFWSTTYKQVRKQLRARYPKHDWPEDPFVGEQL
jgi:ATP-dependent helicase HrpB